MFVRGSKLNNMIKKLALWLLGGQYVPADLLSQARKERDDSDLEWAKRYDSSVQYLQEQSSGYLKRALETEKEFRAFRDSIVADQERAGRAEARAYEALQAGFRELHDAIGSQVCPSVVQETNSDYPFNIDIRVPRKVNR